MKRLTFLLATMLSCLLYSISVDAATQTYNLTANDYFSWSKATAGATKGNKADCAYELNKSTGMPYGDGNVYYLNYADLSKADKLYIVATAGEPRALFNRIVDNGEVRVEIPRDASTYETVVDNKNGSKTYIIDVAKIVKKDGYAHLHAIKGANWQNTTVTSIQYTVVVPDNNSSSNTNTQQYQMSMTEFNPNIWETGKYNYSNGVGTFYAGQYGFGGWHSDAGYDVSKYKSVTVTFAESAINGTSFRLFKVNNYWTDQSNIIATECAGKTSVTVDISNIDKLYYIGFWNYGNANGNYQSYIKIKSVAFTLKDQQQTVTPSTPSEPEPETPQQPEEEVTPTEPETPSTPTEPEPETPTEPEPETPTEPEPETPSVPTFNYIPSDPVVQTVSTNTNVVEEFNTLTANDYFQWTSGTANASKKQSVGCAYDINKSTGMPYGDGSVYYLNYADLSGAYKLYVEATAGEPRLLFNRVVDNGTVNVELPRDNAEYETVITNSNGSKTYVIDIAKIVANEGFAHLHAIKGANWQNTTVTSIKYSVAKSAGAATQSLPLNEFNPNIWETGKYNYSNGVGTFYAGQYGFGGWHFDGGYDVSNYKQVVVTFAEAAINGTSFRLFKVNNYWTGDNNIISTDCSGKTSVTVDISNVNELFYIGFWNYGNANGNYTSNIKIKSVTFIPKADANTNTSVDTKEYAIGDVNGDGKVNSSDRSMLESIINAGKTDNLRADVNEDCVVDENDLTALNAIIAGNYKPTYNWVGTWTTAQQLVEPSNLPPSPGLSGNSLRQIVQVSVGGKKLRLKFSNEFSTSSTEIKAVEIAIAKTAGSSSAIQDGTTKTITFNGSKSVTMKAGEMIVSDPISFSLPARSNVAITIHYGNCNNSVITGHPGSRTTSYLASGNTTNFSSAARTEHWYNICGIDVAGNVMSRAVAILGNSITDGRGSTTNNQDRWSDQFSRALLANEDTRYVSVLNLGIGGNCVLSDTDKGLAGKKRFNRDCLQQDGVKYAIIFEGVNDMGYTNNATQTANDLISAYRSMITEARNKGIKIYGATITPFKNSGYYSAEHEKCRSLVNNWVRTCGLFDGVIDFDKIMRDPSDVESMQRKYFFGDDGLHPNADGYKHMGESIDLDLFLMYNEIVRIIAE